MRTLDQLKHDFINRLIPPTAWLGDSPNRFNTYTKYAMKVDSIVEFGVYTGLSTCAWLAGKPKRLRSYDITDSNLSVLDELANIAKENNTDFKFALANSLEIDKSNKGF